MYKSTTSLRANPFNSATNRSKKRGRNEEESQEVKKKDVDLEFIHNKTLLKLKEGANHSQSESKGNNLCGHCHSAQSTQTPCAYCEYPFCSNCTRQCEKCLDIFCPSCSICNFDMRVDRVFCLQCNAEEVKSHRQGKKT
eukprot:TRINITY_DN11057_c0_g1_i1.p1 TRINITY_DN11057_c0_g1~~TRINITY_DN11057_c0_g1_i1.p1  ORF type:complete len:139 (-),score=22.84 TRINITY_DN11057_c0_g1_i1:130-546(-)